MSIQKTKTNPFSVDASPTHRVGLTENEIVELLTLLHDTKVTVGISRLLMSANLKLNNVYEKASIGKKAPDYVPTGKRRESAINLESLGADTPMPPSGGGTKKTKSDAEFKAELEEAERLGEMLQREFEGGDNHITPDISSDSDSVHTALMSISVTDL